jgi:inhibitor of cysteine peptidase
MNKVLMVCFALVSVLAAVSACSSSEQVSVEVSIDDFMSQKHISEQVEVDVGGTLTVTLGSNPTTGFTWSEEAGIDDVVRLRQTSHSFFGPEKKDETPPPPGAPGKEEWVFEALRTGATTVTMEYSRPWEGGEKGEWTFTLTVIVK